MIREFDRAGIFLKKEIIDEGIEIGGECLDYYL